MISNALLFLLLSLISASSGQENAVRFVPDTIGTAGLLSITGLDIFNPLLEDCSYFQYSEPIFSFKSVYDFNELDTFRFICTTLINGATSFTIEIYVNDTNDHIPIFNQREYKFTFAENVIRSVFFPTASDPDLDPYNIILYSLSGDNLDYFTFLADPPELTSKASLDREVVDQFNLILTATDQDSNISTNASMVIEVEDRNDNPPRFLPNPASYSLSENETSRCVRTFTAEDSDVGLNAEITYSTFRVTFSKNGNAVAKDGSSLFRINSSSAELCLSGALDFEVFDLVNVVIQAKDAGQPSLSAFLAISISVVDVSDTIYRFKLVGVFVKTTGGEIRIEIPENPISRNTELANIYITPSINGNKSLSLLTYPDNSPATLFYRVSLIDSWNLLLNGTLDREEVSSYDLTLMLFVDCNPACSGLTSISLMMRLLIVVIDENDNPPFILNYPMACILVDEGAVGEIYQINASDKDIGSNAELSYFLIRSGEAAMYFSVNETTGAVRIDSALDYEKVENITIDLNVQDGGTTPLSTDFALTVCVRNLDDNRIIFDRFDYSFDLSLGTPLSSPLITVHASDKDKPSLSLFYYIDSPDSHFSLNATTGRLHLNACATPEMNNTLLQVYATNCSQTDTYSCEQSHTNISVHIVPSSPLIRPRYSKCLPMGEEVGQNNSLFSLDISPDLALKLEFSPPVLYASGSGIFSNVSLEQLREACADFSCSISLNNPCDTNSSSSLLNVLLLTAPSNCPLQFSDSSFHFRINEGIPADSLLIDFSNHVCYAELSKVSFHDYSLPFSLNLSRSGSLRVSAELDIDAPNSTALYAFTVQAEAGNLTANASVSITVDPVNDNAPEFMNPLLSITLDSSLSPNQHLAQFTATDADVGSDGNLTYVLAFEQGFLVVNKFTGSVSLSSMARDLLLSLGINVDQPLSSNNSYTANITALDNGSPPLNTSHSFCVFLNVGFMLNRALQPTTYLLLLIMPALCVLATVAMAVVGIGLFAVCRSRYWYTATFEMSSPKTSHDWDVLENPQTSSKENVSHAPAPTTPTPESSKSSGLGNSIASSPPYVPPMTDAEIRHIIDSNRDLVAKLSATPQLQDYNESSPAPPTLTDNDLLLFYDDEASQVSVPNADKNSSSAPPIDIIYANPDNRYLRGSHSPHSSASSSYLSSVSHHRPRIPAAVKRETSTRPKSKLVPLPSSSTPSFSQKVFAHSQQPEHLDSLDTAN